MECMDGSSWEKSRKMLDIGIQLTILVGVTLLSVVPHEYAHKLVLKLYGVDSHFEAIDRDGEKARNFLFVYAILVEPNDNSAMDNFSKGQMFNVAVVGGIASAIFTLMCAILLWPIIGIAAQVVLLAYIVYDLFYAAWEVRNNLRWLEENGGTNGRKKEMLEMRE